MFHLLLTFATARALHNNPLISSTTQVAPGVAVVAPAGEYNHFLRKATIFIVEQTDEATIGVNLLSPTMLTIGEAAPVITGPLAENRLWMGGEHGGRGAIMLHAVPGLDGSKPIGDSDIFVGGIRAAQDLVASGERSSSDFKFFFNVAKWSTDQLQIAVDEGRWTAFQIPTDLVLLQDDSLAIGDLWSVVKRSSKSQNA